MFPPAVGPEVGLKNHSGTRGLAMQWAKGNGRGKAGWFVVGVFRLWR